MLDVVVAYYRIVANLVFVDVADTSVARARQLHEESVARLEAGLVSQLDVLRAEQLVSEAENIQLDAVSLVEDARDELILIHTPHLEDKYKGTRMIMDMIRNESRLKPDRILVDHAEEHTIKHILDGGYWCGMTLYPITKCTPQRSADMIEMYGTERIMVNSAGDWGPSDPMAVPQLIQELKMRGHAESDGTLLASPI